MVEHSYKWLNTTANVGISVVDPNTLNLDPDPDPGLCFQFWDKKLKIILEKTIFFTNYIY